MSKVEASKPKPDWPYTFQEFCDHCAALPLVLDYQHISFGGEWQELDNQRDGGTNYMRVREYMRDLYQEPLEFIFKFTRFLAITMYASEHAQELGISNHSPDGSEPIGLSAPVFRAIHHYYTTGYFPDHEPSAEQILGLAAKYKRPSA